MAYGSSAAGRRHLTDNSGAPALDDTDVDGAGMWADAASPELTVWEPGLPPSARALTGETSLDWAEVAAMLGDYDEALSWLAYAERRHVPIPDELAERRLAWARAVAAKAS
jgi:hypothetical protein